MMSMAEIRGVTLSYFRIRELLDQPLPDDVREIFHDFMQSTAAACHLVTEGSAPARWCRSIVGPVLAAAVGSAIWMREEVSGSVGALRIFGLAGDRPLPNHASWRLVQPYLQEPALSRQALSEIRRLSRIRLNLPADPTPVDVLEELTRRRAGQFPVEVSHWLNAHFRDHMEDHNPYTDLYRRTLEDMAVLNEHGGMASSIGAYWAIGVPTREDWGCIVRGQMPQHWLQIRAANAAVRQFLADYYDKWQEGKHACSPVTTGSGHTLKA